MRTIVLVLALTIAACTENPTSDAPNAIAETSFDGANYANQAEKIAHGKRMSELSGCNACHGSDYAGTDFGSLIPIVKGLWASNISLTMPALSDTQLEDLLRKGTHPDRDLYVMPSKQTQFLSSRDMDALIAFLRTIAKTGKPTPLPPATFRAEVTARLPDDYWLTQEEGFKREYHNAAQEVAYFAKHQPPDLGPELARGRMIGSTLCSVCHGAALDGLGEPAGNIQGVLAYDDAAMDRLLIESINHEGRKVKVEWGFGHEVQKLTASERRDVVAYVRALARERMKRPNQPEGT